MKILFYLLLLIATASATANTNTNTYYNAYNYDMTTPLFTPDGRLLQVEYASIAALERSSPMVALVVRDCDCDCDCDLHFMKDVVVLACMPSVSVQRRKQRRLIPVALANYNDYNDNNKKDDFVCLCMNGVLSDAVSLLGKVRKFMEGKKAVGAVQLANVIGDECQSHAFGGGLRPYGASFLVCGLNVKDRAEIYSTEPSGAVHRMDVENEFYEQEQLCEGHTNASQKRFICRVVGKADVSKRIRDSIVRLLTEQDIDDSSVNENGVRRGIDAIIKAFLEEVNVMNKGNNSSVRDEDLFFRPEIVVLSSGVAHVLEDKDIDCVVNRIRSQIEVE